jgi:hypothetical protein
LEVVIAFFGLIKTGYRHRICFPVTEAFMKYAVIRIPVEYVGGFSLREDTQSTTTIAEYLNAHPDKILFISPEGALAPTKWRSGFYYIAKATKLPLVIAGMDFREHTIKAVMNGGSCEYLSISPTQSYAHIEKEAQRRFAASGICPKHPLCSYPLIDGTECERPTFLPAHRRRQLYFIAAAFVLFRICSLLFHTIA